MVLVAAIKQIGGPAVEPSKAPLRALTFGSFEEVAMEHAAKDARDETATSGSLAGARFSFR